MSDLHCPSCGAELDLGTVFVSAADHQALARLVDLSLPLGARVMQYLSLHTPPKTRLTAAKKIKLLLQLLPDLERGAITFKGRDWSAPQALWAKAIDDMLARRATLDLPLSGHRYLHAMLAGMAEKVEARQEAEAEAARRTPPPAAPVTVRGHPKSIADALAGATSNQPIPPAPPPGPRAESPTVRRMKAELAAKKPTNEGK